VRTLWVSGHVLWAARVQIGSYAARRSRSPIHTVPVAVPRHLLCTVPRHLLPRRSLHVLACFNVRMPRMCSHKMHVLARNAETTTGAEETMRGHSVMRSHSDAPPGRHWSHAAASSVRPYGERGLGCDAASCAVLSAVRSRSCCEQPTSK
jgi:hypothetical protein